MSLLACCQGHATVPAGGAQVCAENQAMPILHRYPLKVGGVSLALHVHERRATIGPGACQGYPAIVTQPYWYSPQPISHRRATSASCLVRGVCTRRSLARLHSFAYKWYSLLAIVMLVPTDTLRACERIEDR
jgi:hypothetical protein